MAGSKKAENKVKAKIIEDKTFGLKNKNKSAKVGRYVAQVEQQVKTSGDRKIQKAEEAKVLMRKLKKEEEEKRKVEAALLSKPVVVQPVVPTGADPKSFLCAFFRVGQCSKGDKCRFSHDLNVERKTTKIDMYSDVRDKVPDLTMERRHGSAAITDIVCKHFLEAVEKRKYGWFWECPNGGDSCKYRHALPPGYVLKTDSPVDPASEESISIEEFLESERQKLGDNLTLVTEETFMAWKEKRRKLKADEEHTKAKSKETDIKMGKTMASGKDLFVLNPDLFDDDVDALESDLLCEREDVMYDHVPKDGQLEALDPSLFVLEEDMDSLDI